MARPIPPAPPVTIATLFWRRPFGEEEVPFVVLVPDMVSLVAFGWAMLGGSLSNRIRFGRDRIYTQLFSI